MYIYIKASKLILKQPNVTSFAQDNIARVILLYCYVYPGEISVLLLNSTTFLFLKKTVVLQFKLSLNLSQNVT